VADRCAHSNVLSKGGLRGRAGRRSQAFVVSAGTDDYTNSGVHSRVVMD
jgi:hypothetical protein